MNNALRTVGTELVLSVSWCLCIYFVMYFLRKEECSIIVITLIVVLCVSYSAWSFPWCSLRGLKAWVGFGFVVWVINHDLN